MTTARVDRNMSSVLDELRFTELNLNLTQFVDRFRSEFPVIMITRTGIDPADDPLHCISAEEVSRIALSQCRAYIYRP